MIAAREARHRPRRTAAIPCLLAALGCPRPTDPSPPRAAPTIDAQAPAAPEPAVAPEPTASRDVVPTASRDAVPTATPAVPPDPTGLTPPPIDDPDLAALPVDVRVATLVPTHRRDCRAFAPRSRCELTLDLDGDGRPERAFKIRARADGAAGIAIAWADGSVSIIAAGAATRQLSTDPYVDTVELGWAAVESDLSLASWRVADARGPGFAVLGGRGTSPTILRAPGRAGDGLWLDGGDAVEILYWDRERWRRLIVGF